MNEQPSTSGSINENAQLKSNFVEKPNLPPKPRIRADQPKLKAAPRPGEAKQNGSAFSTIRSTSNLHNISLNLSKTSSSNESLSLTQNQKPIDSNGNVINSSIKERNLNLNLEIEGKQNQLSSSNEACQKSEKDTSISLGQSKSSSFSNQSQNAEFHETKSSENNSFEVLMPNVPNDSQMMPNFPQISVPPPPFKAKQFKYQSGNLTGTVDFPEFDKKLDEMLRLYQAPRLRKY